VLPMVLDSEPKRTSQEISIQIPSPDSKGFVSKVVPLTPPKGEKGEKAEVKPKPPVIAETPRPSEKPPAKIDTPPTKVEAPKPVEKPKESAKAEGAFFVQVIALADADKAKQVQQQIIDAGLKSYTEVVVAANGNVTRVRAGPFATRDEAEAARKQLLLSGLEGKVGTR